MPRGSGTARIVQSCRIINEIRVLNNGTIEQHGYGCFEMRDFCHGRCDDLRVKRSKHRAVHPTAHTGGYPPPVELLGE